MTTPVDYISIVFATGCPNSGWRSALAVFSESNATEVDPSFRDEFFRSSEHEIRNSSQSTRVLRSRLEKLEPPVYFPDERVTGSLEILASAFAEATFVFFYTPPSIALAHAFAARIDPEVFLKDYQEVNGKLLEFRKKNRERCSLFNATDAAGNIDSILKSFAAHDLRRLKHIAPSTSNEPSVTTLDIYLAQQYITEHAWAKRLENELEAYSQSLDKLNSFSPVTLTDCITGIRALEEANKDAWKENELLLFRLHLVQEELEEYYFKYQQLSKENDSPLPSSLSADTPMPTDTMAARHPFSGSLLFPWPQKLTALFPLLRFFIRISKKDIRLLQNSDLFDADWYLGTYEDVRLAKKDPIEHYVLYGANEGRDPSPWFSSSEYLQQNPDVSAAGVNPLVHYLRHGVKERRKLPDPLP